MATTSPDNIRTPDPGDPYNLVPDLQTLAQDVQDALIARGNVFRGTAAQRVAYLSTASPGMLWQDTDGIGMLWKRGASQWVPAVWRWSGTTAQMNGFTQAPDGFEWFNTTDNNNYVRLSGAWVIGNGTLTTSSFFTAGSGITISADSRVTKIGKQITGLLILTRTSDFTSGLVVGSIASAFRPAANAEQIVSISQGGPSAVGLGVASSGGNLTNWTTASGSRKWVANLNYSVA